MKAMFTACALLAGMALPAGAEAKTTRAELRHDLRDIHQERHDLARAIHSGNPGRIKAERRELRNAKRELREDTRDFIRERQR